jgi:hypothetical protein
MEQAKDINGVIKSSWSFMSYGTLVGQYSYLHKYLLGNRRLVQYLDSISNANPMRLITGVWDLPGIIHVDYQMV